MINLNLKLHTEHFSQYPGVFFQMMTKEMLKIPPNSYADLKARNYTLYFIEARNLKVAILPFIDEKDM